MLINFLQYFCDCEFVLHNGLDTEVYDLHPSDLQYYYYYCYYWDESSGFSSKLRISTWLRGHSKAGELFHGPPGKQQPQPPDRLPGRPSAAIDRTNHPAKVQWPTASCAEADLDQRTVKCRTKTTDSCRGVPTKLADLNPHLVVAEFLIQRSRDADEVFEVGLLLSWLKVRQSNVR